MTAFITPDLQEGKRDVFDTTAIHVSGGTSISPRHQRIHYCSYFKKMSGIIMAAFTAQNLQEGKKDVFDITAFHVSGGISILLKSPNNPLLILL